MLVFRPRRSSEFNPFRQAARWTELSPKRAATCGPSRSRASPTQGMDPDRKSVTAAVRPSSSSCPIEFSKLRGVASFQETSTGSTPARRANRAKIFAAPLEPVVFTTRRSRDSSGFRNGEHTTWRTWLEPHAPPRSTSAMYVVWTSPLRIVIEAGGSPPSPRLTEQSRSTSRRNESWYAAQCSRSTARRSHSPSRWTSATPSTVTDRLVPRLQVVDPGREEDGEGRRDDKMIE